MKVLPRSREIYGRSRDGPRISKKICAWKWFVYIAWFVISQFLVRYILDEFTISTMVRLNKILLGFKQKSFIHLFNFYCLGEKCLSWQKKQRKNPLKFVKYYQKVINHGIINRRSHFDTDTDTIQSPAKKTKYSNDEPSTSHSTSTNSTDFLNIYGTPTHVAQLMQHVCENPEKNGDTDIVVRIPKPTF